jgi:hypothetical protein
MFFIPTVVHVFSLFQVGKHEAYVIQSLTFFKRTLERTCYKVRKEKNMDIEKTVH